MSRKARAFWPVLFVLLVSDCTSKRAAELMLAPVGVPHEVVGDVVRFQLAYNEGAATGLDVGRHSRVVFSVMAVFGVLVLARLYRQAARDDWRLGLAIALIIGGALGNLLDRLRSPLGVVDFIDVGVGGARFWIFNVADVGVTLGAGLLAALLWRRG